MTALRDCAAALAAAWSDPLVPPLRGVIVTDATTSTMSVEVDVSPAREPADD